MLSRFQMKTHVKLLENKPILSDLIFLIFKINPFLNGIDEIKIIIKGKLSVLLFLINRF